MLEPVLIACELLKSVFDESIEGKAKVRVWKFYGYTS